MHPICHIIQAPTQQKIEFQKGLQLRQCLEDTLVVILKRTGLVKQSLMFVNVKKNLCIKKTCIPFAILFRGPPNNQHSIFNPLIFGHVGGKNLKKIVKCQFFFSSGIISPRRRTSSTKQYSESCLIVKKNSLH